VRYSNLLGSAAPISGSTSGGFAGADHPTPTSPPRSARRPWTGSGLSAIISEVPRRLALLAELVLSLARLQPVAPELEF